MNNLNARLAKLEGCINVDPAHIFLDDEPTLELTGFHVCCYGPGDSILMEKQPGESIDALKDRCRQKDRELRKAVGPMQSAGTIFTGVYDYDKKRADHEQTAQYFRRG